MLATYLFRYISKVAPRVLCAVIGLLQTEELLERFLDLGVFGFGEPPLVHVPLLQLPQVHLACLAQPKTGINFIF